MDLEPLRSSYIGRGVEDAEDGMVGGPAATTPGEVDLAASLLSSRSFYFAERTRPMDIETLRGLDLQRIEDEVDVEALQRHLEELTFGDLGKSVAAPLGVEPRHADFLKLFRLAQLTVEYLLNVQDVLAEGLDASSRKCLDAQHRVEKYKKRARDADARIKTLKADLKVKRGAIHTYEALISDTRRHGPSKSRSSSFNRSSSLPHQRVAATTTSDALRRSRDDNAADDDVDPYGELTVYVSSPDGTCAQHSVDPATTAGDLANRFRHSRADSERLLHRGVELARDASLKACGVKSGDTLVLAPAFGSSTSSGPWRTSAVHHDGTLDRRIAELEASIRSEMAIQVQTQLASLRGSLSGGPSIGGLGAWGDCAGPGSGQQQQGRSCIAGALEDDDEDLVLRQPPASGHVEYTQENNNHSELRAAERRLQDQMNALEDRMNGMGAGASAPRAATAPASPARRSPSRPAPASNVGNKKNRKNKPPTEDPFGPWTLTCPVLSRAADEALVGGSGGEGDGAMELVVDPADTLADLRASVAEDLDVEVDRVRFRSRATGGDIADVAALKVANGQDDACCHVVRGRLVSDEQVDALRLMRKSLARTHLATSGDGNSALDARLEDAVADRQATWRHLPAAHGSSSTLSQADVARLQVRVSALHDLLDAVDRTPAFDDDMISTLSAALETVCQGLPPSVNDAILRVRANIDERATLLASKQPPP